MATMQGITGKMSGRMGSAVFRVREGQQVVTQYNPIVKNPNTAGQQNQRAKFKLMSQLASVMAPGFGTMSVTSRKAKGKPSQRNAFTQLNFPLVEVSSDDQEVTAKIPMENVKLTSSFRNLPDLAAGDMVEQIEVIIQNVPADVASVRFVVIAYEDNIPSLFEVKDIPVNQAKKAVYDKANLTAGEKYTVLAYGLIPSESAKASIDLDNIHTLEDEDFTSAIELNAMVAEGSMVETMTKGINVTVAGN